MTQYTLNIVRDGKTVATHTLQNGQTMHLAAEGNTQYQLLNERGVLLSDPASQLSGSDLWVLPENGKAILVLENYSAYQPIGDSMTLMNLNSTFALTAVEQQVATPLLATEVSGGTAAISSGVSTPAIIGGVLAVGALAAAAGGGGGNNANSNTRPTQPEKDTDGGKPTVTINAVNGGDTLNKTDLAGTVKLSGSLNYPEDVSADNVSVSVTIAGKTLVATVNGKTWTLDVAGSSLGTAQGKAKVTATINTVDNAGNKASASTGSTYEIDTVAQVKLTLDNITEDNIINATEVSAGKISITGRVAGDFEAGDTVNITAGSLKMTAKVLANGEFSASVDAAQLAAQSDKTVTASIATSDDSGNAASASAKQAYTVSNETLSITINKIANDNVLNVTEAQEKVSISGSVAGAGAKAGQEVTVEAVDKTYTTKVLNDLSFTVQADGSVLADNQDYDVTAKVKTASGMIASSSKTYTAAADTAASIHITSIDADGSIETTEMVRLTGKVNVDGEWAKYLNAKGLHSVTLNIGGNIFQGGISDDDQTFYVDIPAERLADLNGQTVSVSVQTNESLPDLVDNRDRTWGLSGSNTVLDADWIISNKTAPTITADKVTFDSNSVLKASGNNQYTIDAGKVDDALYATVKGNVNGSAKAGDTVSILVNNQNYAGKVQADLGFAIDVKQSDLEAQQEHSITATLVTKDLAGKTISVSDSTVYAGATVGEGTHLIETSGNVAYDDLPYFIKALGIEPYWLNKGSAFLDNHLNINNNPVGSGNVVIKYHFVTNSEFSSLRNGADSQLLEVLNADPITYSVTNQNVVRSALETISKYADIKFQEVDSADDANINYFMADFSHIPSTSHNTLGFAYFNDFVVLSKSHYGMANNNLDSTEGFITAIHETMHSLGLKHPFLDKDDPKDLPSLSNQEDQMGLTLMSYTPDDFVGTRDLRMYDLAYLHYRFGVADSARKNNDTYSFKTFNPSSSDGDIYIWDGAGVDTFDASMQSQGVNINLTPGSWIYSGSKEAIFAVESLYTDNFRDYFGLSSSSSIYNVQQDDISDPTMVINKPFNFTGNQAFIGYDTQIENLIGSAYDDKLTGNNAHNSIFGGAGNDIINGGAGNDYLDGGVGKDTLIGGTGNDSYVLDNSSDTIIEAANAGSDTVYSSLTNYTLGYNLENVIIIGAGRNATGNDAANQLTGNNEANILNGGAGDDIINGGAGSDTLTGGAGKDTFVFSSLLDGSVDKITDFGNGDDILHLSKSVFSALSNVNASTWDDYLKYNATTGELAYDADGTGSADAIVFATLNTNLTFTQADYSLIA